MANHPNLPLELVDTIIDHLSDDRDALVSCALAARPLLKRSRRHLFRHLSLNLDPDPNERLRELCSRPLYFLTSVRSLYVDTWCSKAPVSSQLFSAFVRSLVNLTRLEINRLCNLNFKFSNIPDPHYAISGTDIFQDCCLPNIQSLILVQNNAIPCDELYRCTSLTHVSLTHCGFVPNQHVPVSMPRIPLKSLFLGPPDNSCSTIRVPQVFDHPSCPWDLSQLEAFAFCALNERDYHEMLKLLERFPKTITTLAFDVPIIETEDSGLEVFAPAGPLVDLAMLPDLTSVTFLITEDVPCEDTVSRIPWAIRQLEKIDIDNRIVELHLWFVLSSQFTDDMIQSLEWGKLDDCLTGMRFDKLEHVFIKAAHGDEFSADIVALFQSFLPKTRMQKFLHINIASGEWLYLYELF